MIDMIIVTNPVDTKLQMRLPFSTTVDANGSKQMTIPHIEALENIYSKFHEVAMSPLGVPWRTISLEKDGENGQWFRRRRRVVGITAAVSAVCTPHAIASPPLLRFTAKRRRIRKLTPLGILFC